MILGAILIGGAVGIVGGLWLVKWIATRFFTCRTLGPFAHSGCERRDVPPQAIHVLFCKTCGAWWLGYEDATYLVDGGGTRTTWERQEGAYDGRNYSRINEH